MKKVNLKIRKASIICNGKLSTQTKSLFLGVLLNLILLNLNATVGQLVNGIPIVTVDRVNFQNQIQSDLTAIGYTNISLQSMEITNYGLLPEFKYFVTCTSSEGDNRKMSVSVPLIYNYSTNFFEIDNVQIQNGGRKVMKCVGTNCGEGGCILTEDSKDCTNCNPPADAKSPNCQKSNSNDGGNNGGGIEPWLTALVGLISAWVTWLLGH